MPIRVVRDKSDLTATLESTAPRDAGTAVTFIGFAFDVVPPDMTATAIPQCKIEIDNVTSEILAQIDAAMGSSELVTVIYRAYLSNDLTVPSNNPPLTMNVLAITATMFRITATCGFDNLANKRFPSMTYTSEIFPGLILQ